MGATKYAISWLYGEFRIARFHRNKLVERWEADTLVDSQPELIRALSSAQGAIDLRRRGEITIVHEHDLHTHDYLEVPHMKKRDLEKYLQRRVEQDKSFEGSAAWCYHKVKHRGGKEGVLLHLLPKRVVNATTEACEVFFGMPPKRYVPLTEIVSNYLPGLQLESDQLFVVVACFQERTEIILALGDGEALFVRELNYGQSADDLERLLTDINRTIRYTRQQLARGVESVVMMGEYDPAQAGEIEAKIEVPVSFDEPSTDLFFWAEQGLRLSGTLSANFISKFAQNNITVDVLRRAGVFATATVTAIAVITFLFISGLVAHREQQIATVKARTEVVAQKVADVKERLALGRSKQDHLNRLRASSHNLPSLFLVHLSDLVPPEITLSQVEINQGNPGWSVSLRGQVAGDLRSGARTLAHFEEALTRVPWYVGITRSFRDSWMQQFEQGKLRETGALGFSIEGDLQ